MEENKRNGRTDERRRFFQLLAGGYLVYLAYQLISGALKEAGWTTLRCVGLGSGVLFGAFGIFLLIKNLKAEKAAKQKDGPDDPGEGDAQ